MRWLRSIVAIGAGVAVAWALFSLVAVRTYEDCDYGYAREGPCALAYPGLPGATATVLAMDMFGPDLMRGEVRTVFGRAAAMVVAGFATAMIAPRWRLRHAALVGPLFLCMLDVMVRSFSLQNVAQSVVWAVPAALGGVLGSALASRLPKSTAQL